MKRFLVRMQEVLEHDPSFSSILDNSDAQNEIENLKATVRNLTREVSYDKCFSIIERQTH